MSRQLFNVKVIPVVSSVVSRRRRHEFERQRFFVQPRRAAFRIFPGLFVIGEAEEVLLDITECYKAHRNLPREELLLKLANVEGVYVPHF